MTENFVVLLYSITTKQNKIPNSNPKQNNFPVEKCFSFAHLPIENYSNLSLGRNIFADI